MNAELRRLGLDRSPSQRAADSASAAAVARQRALDRHAATSASQQAERPPPMTPDDLQSLPSQAWEDGGGGEPSCAICTNAFVTGERVTRLPCSHTFHRECISSWLERASSCPICRCQLPSTCKPAAGRPHSLQQHRSSPLFDEDAESALQILLSSEVDAMRTAAASLRAQLEEVQGQHGWRSEREAAGTSAGTLATIEAWPSLFSRARLGPEREAFTASVTQSRV